MSNVAIKGGATGTATYTIEAPTGNTDRTLALPDEAGTVLTSGTAASSIPGYGNNITMVDQFRLTADASGTADLVNLERTDEPSSGTIGTGMTVSSGIFTFPSTGIYLILVSANFFADTGDGTVQIAIQVTENNVNYSEYGVANGGNTGSDGAGASGQGHLILDVTDTANVKIKFKSNSLSGSSVVNGDTNRNETTFTFIRLGDT